MGECVKGRRGGGVSTLCVCLVLCVSVYNCVCVSLIDEQIDGKR
jgi:hypothetical protein